MTIFVVITIIMAVMVAIGVVWGIKTDWDNAPVWITGICVFAGITMLIVSIAQAISLKQEMVRQDKERQQIVYQIENLTEANDKVKLNEWILTYNDWVNDVNTSKECFGWFSWYYTVDMSGHTVIQLV